MTVNLTGNDNPLLTFFSAYESAYSQAQSLVSLATLGLNTPTWLEPPLIPDTQPKTFVLAYLPAQVSNSIPTGQGTPPQSSPIPTATNPIIFDVSLDYAPSAVPQRVAYTSASRQSIEQTVVGFHVNQFGLAPGRLDIDAIIVYQGMQYAQVQAFFSFLQGVVASNPLNSMTPPGQVLFIDVYLQRQLYITVETIMIEEIAGSNNQAHLVMTASVLKDFSQPSSNNVTQDGIPVSLLQLEAAAGLLNGALSFLGVSLPI